MRSDDAGIIALAYVVFGATALGITRTTFFLFTFLLPGLLLLFASSGWDGMTEPRVP